MDVDRLTSAQMRSIKHHPGITSLRLRYKSAEPGAERLLASFIQVEDLEMFTFLTVVKLLPFQLLCISISAEQMMAKTMAGKRVSPDKLIKYSDSVSVVVRIVRSAM